MKSSEFEDSYEDKERIRGAILNTPINELPLRQPVLVEAGSKVYAAVEAMREHHIGCVLVQKAGKLVGIFTERDALNRVIYQDDKRTISVEDVMTSNPETLPASESLAFALNRMCVGGYRHIPIVDDDGNAIAVVSVRDIVGFLVELFPSGVLNLPCNPSLGIARDTDGG